jgi:two-component system sensor histidine kinase/response regulator
MNLDLQGSGVDRELALARVGGDTDLLKEIAKLFLEEYPKMLVELRDAAAKGDAQALERIAHGLKGSVANFGARAAVDAALKLEDMGHARKLVEVSQSLHALDQALATLRPELEAL